MRPARSVGEGFSEDVGSLLGALNKREMNARGVTYLFQPRSRHAVCAAEVAHGWAASRSDTGNHGLAILQHVPRGPAGCHGATTIAWGGDANAIPQGLGRKAALPQSIGGGHKLGLGSAMADAVLPLANTRYGGKQIWGPRVWR